MKDNSERDIPLTDDFGVPVHVIEKRSSEQFRISINEFKGHQYIDLRSFYLKDEVFLPSKKGATLPVECFPELLHGVMLLGQALGFDVDLDDD